MFVGTADADPRAEPSVRTGARARKKDDAPRARSGRVHRGRARRARRIVTPDHASTSGGDGGRDAADRIERLHGYVVRGEVTAAPALIARGLVEGTTWEELHADLVSLGDDGDDDDADLSSAAR